jgi:glycosyltransferase involved in cell wall biosynthesis
MLRYRRVAATADVVHFQWLTTPVLDLRLLPDRPLVLTAHDLLPREPRPGQTVAQRRLLERMDAVIVHSEFGRRQLVEALSLDPETVHVVPHGAFAHHAAQAHARPLPADLAAVEKPVVLFFGLLRPYKGIQTLLDAWQGIEGAELWIVGRSRMPLAPLRARAGGAAGAAGGAVVRFVPRFVSDDELPAFFRRADVVVLPYARTERFDQSGVLATALAFGNTIVLSDIGGFAEVAATGAAELVPAGDPVALRETLTGLLGDPGRRERLSRAALAAASGPYSWEEAARRTLAVYRQLGA